MNNNAENKGMFWTGWVLSVVVLLPMVMSAVMKAKGGPKLDEGFTHLGFPLSLLKTLIVLESAAIILYAIPATAVVGAILLTGYMGGAICTHLRVGENVAIQTAIPIVAWLGLWLREPRLRAILPLRR